VASPAIAVRPGSGAVYTPRVSALWANYLPRWLEWLADLEDAGVEPEHKPKRAIVPPALGGSA